MDIQKLKGARVAKGFTQETMAEVLDISTKTYNRKELGFVEFNRREIAVLVEVLELTQDEISQIFLT
jgi:DNA-binding XRE family transcriptional regulator